MYKRAESQTRERKSKDSLSQTDMYLYSVHKPGKEERDESKRKVSQGWEDDIINENW